MTLFETISDLELLMRKYLVLSTLFTACLTFVSAQKASEQVIKSNSQTKSSKVEISRSTVIALERSRCYGSCPSYKIEIYGDGKFIYQGKDFVKTKGKVTGTVTTEQLEQIISEVEKARFFSMRSSYEKEGCTTMATDSPWVYTSIQINKKKKSISHYTGCDGGNKQFSSGLQRLKKLEDKIDAIVNIEKWIGTEVERSKFTFKALN